MTSQKTAAEETTSGPSARFWIGAPEILACSRLSVSEDDRKSERAKSGISCERDPGVKRRGRESL